MVAYIKSIHDFNTLGVYPIAEYELHTSINDEVSTVVVDTKGLEAIEKGNILLLDGNSYIGIIQSVENENNRCTLNCVQIINILNQDCYGWYLDQLSYTSWIERVWGLSWILYFDGAVVIGDEDTFYNRQNYMKSVPDRQTQTAGIVRPDTDEHYIYNWLAWAQKLRNTYQINVWFYWDNEHLYFYPARNTNDEKYIDLMSPNLQFLSEEYSSINVAKVTVVYAMVEDTPSNFSYKEYTLFSDGEIVETTEDRPITQENRVEGEWKVTYTQNEEDVEATARDVLCRAQYGHKITFYTTDNYELYDKVKLRTPAGKIVRSFVSGITETKGSNYKLIECGELQTNYPYI